MAKGLDYSYGRPNLDLIAAQGYEFVMRYLCYPGPRKRLTAPELAEIARVGLKLGLVWETQARAMQQGRDEGIRSATEACRQLDELGLPATQPVYFACDWNASDADQLAVNSYLDGVATVLPTERIGIYGGVNTVRRTLDAGKASWAWQTYAWSRGTWEPRAQIRQVQNNVQVAGAACDLDESTTADYGCWTLVPASGADPVAGSRCR